MHWDRTRKWISAAFQLDTWSILDHYLELFGSSLQGPTEEGDWFVSKLEPRRSSGLRRL